MVKTPRRTEDSPPDEVSPSDPKILSEDKAVATSNAPVDPALVDEAPLETSAGPETPPQGIPSGGGSSYADDPGNVISLLTMSDRISQTILEGNHSLLALRSADAIARASLSIPRNQPLEPTVLSAPEPGPDLPGDSPAGGTLRGHTPPDDNDATDVAPDDNDQTGMIEFGIDTTATGGGPTPDPTIELVGSLHAVPIIGSTGRLDGIDFYDYRT